MFFFFSWIFSSAGGVLFLLRSWEVNAGGAKHRCARIPLFHFPFRRTRSSRSRRERPSNSSCDGIWFVLASCPHEAHSITPHHRTLHTRDTLKMGRDWPVMPSLGHNPAIQQLAVANRSEPDVWLEIRGEFTCLISNSRCRFRRSMQHHLLI